MICCSYECLIDPPECPPSISVLLLLLFSPQDALCPLVSAAAIRFGPPVAAAEMEVSQLNWKRRLQTCLSVHWRRREGAPGRFSVFVSIKEL